SAPLFLGIMQELWRICRHEAEIEITVPHPRHDYFLWDPTHVRPITWEGLDCFNQDKNRQRIASGAANTPLGLQLGIDFRITKVAHTLDEYWRQRLAGGEMSNAEVEFHARHYNNVVAETQINLVAIKAPPSQGSNAAPA
ncbi:MAG: hypothetical protein HY055_04270, partial [Magnetospirillum sp.]|nr:hypothetical protein [Magnetospirillum sp.]